MEEDDCESFGQSIPLTQILKNILKDYPPGTQILRELLQNADDAGATEFRVTLDENPTLVGHLEGPSLICYNNSKFEEKDFKSISSLGNSRKESEKDKTGRFGIGFNSVYHLTDYPNFVTGKYAVLFDPHYDLVTTLVKSFDRGGDPGTRTDLLKSHGRVTPIRTFFSSLDNHFNFQLDANQEFEGTMFRFPLRTNERALKSKISTSAFTSEDIKEMFISFAKEAVTDAIFLKNITTISIHYRPLQGNIQDWYHMEIVQNEHDAKEKQKLKLLLNQFEQVIQHGPTDDYNALYQFKVNQNFHAVDGLQEQKEIAETWMCSGYLGATKSMAMAKDALDNKSSTKRIPYGCVAARLKTTAEHNDGQSSKSLLKDARAYCFLPMPDSTMLPVHINSFFELSSNRRELWKESCDLIGEAKQKSSWNESLKSDVLAPAYVRLLNHLKQIGNLLTKSELFSLFPTYDCQSDWSTITSHVYQEIYDSDLKLFDTFSNALVCASDVCLLLDENVASENARAVNQVATMMMNVCELPNHVITSFKRSDRNIRRIEPEMFLTALKNKFEMCHQDLIDDQPILHFCYNVLNSSNIVGVPLLRVLPHDLFCFGKNTVYLCNQEQILLLEPFISQLSPSLISRITPILKDVSSNFSTSKLVVMNHNHFCICLLKILKNDTNEKEKTASPFSDNKLIKSLNDYMADCSEEDEKLFNKLPLVPTVVVDSARQLKHMMSPLEAAVVRDLQNVFEDNQFIEIRIALERCGLRIVEHSMNDVLTHIPPLKLSVIVELISKYLKHRPDSSLYLMFLQLFRMMFDSTVSQGTIQTISQLPIFKTFGKSSRMYTTLDKQHELPPKTIKSSIALGNLHLDYKDKEAQFLIDVFKVKRMTEVNYYTKVLFPEINNGRIEVDQQVINLLDAALSKVFKFNDINPEFSQSLGEIKFIYVSGLERHLSPCELIDPRKSDVVKLLEGTDFYHDLVPENYEKFLPMLEKCSMVQTVSPSMLSKYIYSTDYNFLVKLVDYLKSQNEHELQQYKHVFDENENVEWLPCMNQTLGSIKDTLPKSSYNLVHTVPGVHICNIDVSKALQKIFNWNQSVPIDMVLQHMENMQVEYADGRITQESFMTILYDQIYSYLDSVSQDEQQAERIKDIGYLVIEGRRVPYSAVAESYPKSWNADFSPYIYKLPKSLLKYKKLLNVTGVKQQFDCDDLFKILEGIPSHHDPSSKIQTAIQLMNLITSERFTNDKITSGQVELPTQSGKFLPANRTFYQKSNSCNEYESKRLNSSISFEIAQHFNVQSLEDHVAVENQLWVEDFGQSEDLCDRINNIIKEYSDKESLFRELLQNADDAGADQFSMILDLNHYPTSSIIKGHSNDIQGPSIIAYNNKTFKDSDWKSIQNINGKFKIHEKSKIGRFGLGFNTVYRYTEVPCILSGDKLAFLDPQQKYIPCGKMPGLCYNVIKTSSTFEDTYKPFARSEIKYDTRKKLDGTLIRIPLRTRKQAETSRLLNEAVTTDMAIKLIDQFKQDAPNLLIFLNNIRHIKLYIDDENGSREIVSISKTRSAELDYMSDDVYQVENYLHAQTSNKVAGTKPIASSRVGKVDMIIKDGKENKRTWLVSGYTAGTNSMQFAIDHCKNKITEKHRMIPHASVAIELTSTTANRKHNMYCFLPIIQTKYELPFHTNGYFELYSSRMDLIQNQNSGHCDISEWNNLLISECVAVSVVNLIQHQLEHLTSKIPYLKSTKDIDQKYSSLLSLFPHVAPDSNFYCLIRPFYQLISQKPFFYLINSSKFVCLKDTIVLSKENQRQNIDLVIKRLPLVILNETIIQKFKESKVELNMFNKNNIAAWFKLQKNVVDISAEFVEQLWKVLLQPSDEQMPSFKKLPVVNRAGGICFLSRRNKLYDQGDNVYLFTVIPSLKSQFIMIPTNLNNLEPFTKKYSYQNFINDMNGVEIPPYSKEHDLYYDALYKLVIRAVDDKTSILQQKYPIVPTNNGMKRLDQIKNVYHSEDSRLTNVLSEIGVDVLKMDNNPLCSLYANIKRLVTVINDRKTLCDALYLSNFDKMKNESCDTIVSCYYDLRASNDRTLDILNFPLFPLINGERTTLKELNADIYLNNPLGDALLESTKCPPIKILKNSHPYSYIYHDVKQLKKFDYLHFAEHHVFKKWFEKQDEETCHKHLEVLRQHTLNFVIKRNNQLFEKIKCLKFVVGEDNSKYSISELYDPTIALFQSFGKNLQLVFPSTQFAEPKWISLLKPLGMITTINKSFVVRCLMLLMQEKDEKLAIEKFSELKPYIELFSEDVDVINNAVVPIVKLDQTKYPNCMKVDTLFKNIKNVVDYSSVDLVFTTKHVFNHSYLGYIKKLHPNYKIESIDVYNHLKTICQLPITENTSRVVKNIYNHLHKYTVDMPKDLQEYPVVLLNNEFIRPNRVFSSIEKDYKPFIYKLHPEYLKSLKFFQCVGVEDQPSREICRSLLNELFYMNKDQTRCNPTQVDLSLYLIRTLVTKYNDDLFDSYLLDHRIALQQINHITVNNAPYLLKKIHDDTFNFLHPELIDLASKLNLKYLSQQVTSEYSSGDKIEQATKYDVQSIQSKIRSPEFRSSVLRLFMNQMSHCEQIPINKYNNLQEQLKKLESIEVSEVDQIQCIYRHDGKDISRRDVEPVSSCVYEQSMLLLPQRYSNLIDIYLIIARELNKSFMLQDQSLLLILLKTDIENMVSVLDEYGVPNTEDNTLSLIRKLGHQVDAEDDHKFVVPVSADNVTVDELVAYIKDNIKYYGRVLCIKNYCSIDTGSGAVEMKLSDLLKYQEAVTNVTLNAPSRSPIDALKDSLRCSISRSVFIDPVVACDGVTYEREYILSWFSRHMTSPVTNLRLENTRVIPNLLIKTIVSDFSFEN